MWPPFLFGAIPTYGVLPYTMIIILTAIQAHGERSTLFTQAAFVCLGRNSLSGYYLVSSRSTSVAFYDAQNFRGYSQENTQMLRTQGRAIAVDLELT